MGCGEERVGCARAECTARSCASRPPLAADAQLHTLHAVTILAKKALTNAGLPKVCGERRGGGEREREVAGSGNIYPAAAGHIFRYVARLLPTAHHAVAQPTGPATHWPIAGGCSSKCASLSCCSKVSKGAGRQARQCARWLTLCGTAHAAAQGCILLPSHFSVLSALAILGFVQQLAISLAADLQNRPGMVAGVQKQNIVPRQRCRQPAVLPSPRQSPWPT